MPRVTVILTSYNHARFLQESIDSVLDQYFRDFELIIWDDASTDESWEIIQTFSDSRIRKFRNLRNKGPVFGVNKAIFEIATGEYIAIHHCDDVWEADKLQEQVPVLDAHPEIGAVFTWVKVIDERGQEKPDQWFNQEDRSRWQWLNSLFSLCNQLAHPSVLIRKCCYDEVGGYKNFLAQAPDAEMWARLLLRRSIHVIPKRLTRHRLQSDRSNTSGDRTDVAIRASNEWNVLRKNFLCIDSFDSLLAIFPNLERYKSPAGCNVRFLLAMTCLQECADRAAWYLGLEWLFDLFGNEPEAIELYRLYSFTYKDLMELAGKFDVFAIEELEQRAGEINALANEVSSRDREISDLAQTLGVRCDENTSLSETIAVRNGEVLARTQDLAAREAQLEAVSRALATCEQEVAAHARSLRELRERTATLDQGLAESQSEVELLKASLSWKVTAPLRALRQSLRRAADSLILRRDAVPQPIAVRSSENPFEAFVRDHLDAEAYLGAYPDVRAARLDPVKHWLEYGWIEGRLLYPEAAVVVGDGELTDLPGVGWQHFSWQGKSIAVRVSRSMKRSLIRHIVSQGRHDPAVLASGSLAIDKLRQFDATDLLARDLVNVPKVFGSIHELPRTILLIPTLCIGGAEKYAADLVAALHSLEQGPILVLVTESCLQDVSGWSALDILAPFRHVNLIFWRDVCGPGYANPTVLARLLNALRPAKIVVINSRIGLDVIAKFGRGLSQSARLYCAYFSMGVKGLGVPYGTRYPHRTLPYSAALTDNSEMVDCLRRLWDGLTGPGIIELPAKIEVADDQLFQHRLESRTRRACKLSRQIRWLWISRVEVFKGTTILAEIARQRPNDQFDVFGPISGSLADLGLTSSNLRHCGILSAISAADFTDYDGFLFTSLFEGMPNVVLEMSQHAIPMVVADVGGLRGTFGDDSVRFVKHADTVEESATSYLAALDLVARMTMNEVSAMVKAARVQVRQRHSPEVYKDNVSRIFVHGNAHV